MGKSLIICEKPTLAKNVTKGIYLLGEKSNYLDGYYESDSYITVAAFGHLLTLYDIDDYLPALNEGEKRGWGDTPLPFYPPDGKFKYKIKSDPKTKKPDKEVVARVKLIKELINRKDIDSIIHCGDSDREGEIIVREILMLAGNKKPVYRIWLPDQVESTIANQLRNLEPDSKYDSLASEGFARTYMDWIYGINLTRYATIKANSLLVVGRVIGAIVKTIYDRDMAIENFVPVDYFAVKGNCKVDDVDINVKSKHEFSKDQQKEAEALADKYNQTGTKVTDIKKKQKTVSSPKLFSQSTLQNAMSKRYKFSPKKTLDIAQILYEKGFLSYPRTPTEYLATAEKGKMKQIIEKIAETGKKIKFKDSKRIFDDSKIESHSAITPTLNLPEEKDFGSDEEKLLYETVMNRFCAVFCEEDCLVDQTDIILSVGDLEDFKLTGIVVLSQGWRSFEKSEKEDTVLPDLTLGQSVPMVYRSSAEQTKPPKHYTVETLNNYLKNPFKEELEEIKNEQGDTDQDDTEDYKAILSGSEIGTEATRPGIIANAIARKYISLGKTEYRIEAGGKYLVEVMEKLNIDMSKSKTVMLNQTIKKTYKGEISLSDAVDVAKEEVGSIIKLDNGLEGVDMDNAPGKEEKKTYGVCPKCHKHNIVETPNAFSCEDRECKFALWKTDKFFASFGKKITGKIAKDLVTKGQTTLTKLVSKKTGREYSIIIKMKLDEKGYVKYETEFPKK